MNRDRLVAPQARERHRRDPVSERDRIGSEVKEKPEAEALSELVAKDAEAGNVAQPRCPGGLDLDSHHIAARVLDHQIDLMARLSR
jgi:hypothetical protein